MSTFSNEEYADIHFIYGFCNGNARAAVTEYHRRFPNRRVPDRRVFSNVHRSIKFTGKVPNKNLERPLRRHRQVEDAILATVDRTPTISIRRLSAQTNVSKTTIWKILRDYDLYPFHFMNVQALQPNDYPARVNFCHVLLRNRQIHTKILFTDEATFTRDGITNNRNSHVWSPREENPHAITETHFQNRFSVNIWCGIIGNRLIGPIIIEDHLNAERYLHLLQEQLPELLEDLPLNIRTQMWFQQDGAPPHFSRIVTRYLNEKFPERWIGRGGPINWPARSPDLSPLDYFLWGHMKSLVYADKPVNRQQLLNKITDACNNIRNDAELLLRSTTSIIQRAEVCVDQNGGHFEQFIK